MRETSLFRAMSSGEDTLLCISREKVGTKTGIIELMTFAKFATTSDNAKTTLLSTLRSITYFAK